MFCVVEELRENITKLLGFFFQQAKIFFKKWNIYNIYNIYIYIILGNGPKNLS